MQWEKIKLGEVCSVYGGTTPSTLVDEYWNGEILWISPTDLPAIGEISIVTGSARKITERATKESSITILPKGSVIYSTRASIGKIGIAGIPLTTNQGFTNLVCGEHIFNRYLAYTLKWFTSEIAKLGNSTTFPEVSRTAIKNFLIPLPPLPIQRAIADRLDRADALRQKDRQLLQAYDELAQAVFVEMFGDPVRNEKGWEVKKVEDTASTRLGKMLDAKKITGTQSAPYLGNSNVQWFSFILDSLKEMDFSDKEKRIFDLKKGDILMCEGGEVGRCAIWEKEDSNIFYQKAIHRIRVDKYQLEPLYFVWLMFFFVKLDGLKDYVSSVTISHFTGEKLRSMKIPLPPLPLQIKFATILANIEQQKELVRKQQAESEALFGRLLQEAFGN